MKIKQAYTPTAWEPMETYGEPEWNSQILAYCEGSESPRWLYWAQGAWMDSARRDFVPVFPTWWLRIPEEDPREGKNSTQMGIKCSHLAGN